MKSTLRLYKITLLFFISQLCFLVPNLVHASSIEELVTNGAFDNGTNHWTCDDCIIDDSYAIDGNFITLGQSNVIQSIGQRITVPESTTVTLSFDYRFYTDDFEDTDYFGIIVQDTDNGEDYILDTHYASEGDQSDWESVSYDLSAASGRTVNLVLLVNQDNTYFSFADIDNISIQATLDRVIDQFGTLEIHKKRASVYWIDDDLTGKVRLQVWQHKSSGWEKIRSNKFPASYNGIQIARLKSNKLYKVRAKYVNGSVWTDWVFFRTN